ncbi:MAG: nicotinate (nicotinamide) nucleotide adenylyltransferase [Bradymonadaceae bacterium]
MTIRTNTQVGLFGGSFNPPHVCHTLATLWALQTHPLDEVWWIPTYQHAFAKDLASYDHRRRMCELATAPISRVRIVDIERELGGESRTIDTVRALKERHPDTTFHLIVGADILAETHRWKNWDELLELVQLLVVGRTGFNDENLEAGIDLRLPNISSTTIRKALSRCDYDSLRPWMPRDVLDYIHEHRLYVPPSCP